MAKRKLSRSYSHLTRRHLWRLLLFSRMSQPLSRRVATRASRNCSFSG